MPQRETADRPLPRRVQAATLAVVVALSVTVVMACSGSVFEPVGSALPGPLRDSTGAVFYVAPNGSDANPGSLDRPWQNLQHAFDSVGPGETIMVRNGVYPAWTSWEKQSGTEERPMTLRAYPGEHPVITGALRIRSSWVRVTGLTFEGGTDANTTEVLIYVSGADHVEISHNDLHGAHKSAMFLGDGDNTADDVRIVANHIHDNGASPQFDHGIYCGHAIDALIVNNVVERNTAFGLQIYPNCDGALIANNTIVANGRAGVLVGGNSEITTSHVRVVNNVVFGNGEGVVGYWPGQVGVGNRVERNLIADNKDSFVDGKLLNIGNVSSSPRFVDYANDDYRLAPRSPAIDAAIPQYSPVVDYDGNRRTVGRYPDLGAFEAQ
jgi:pectate disaccharide-lyase